MFSPRRSCLFLLICMPSVLSAQPINELVVFGDSDSAVSPRYTDDFNWVDALALRLDLPFTQSSQQGGLNYSRGGSHTGFGSDFGGSAPRVGTQIDQHLRTNQPNDNQLFTLLAGSNDFVFGGFDPSVTLANLTGHINKLIDAGAKNLIVVNVPPVYHDPGTRNTNVAETLRQKVNDFNDQLGPLVQKVATEHDVSLTFVDYDGLVNEIIDEPSRFEIIDVDHYSEGNANANPNEYLYWDGHYTSAVHGILADRAIDLLPRYLRPKFTSLITKEDDWQFHTGTTEPPGGENLAWTQRGFESEWTTGAEGFGYGRPDDLQFVNTTLENTQGTFTTLYARHPFDVENVAPLASLKLHVDYDDAFVAYINGVEVARSDGVVGDIVPFDATSEKSHESGLRELFSIDLAEFPGLLRDGSNNVLSIQGIKLSLSDSDFVLAQLRLDGIMLHGDFDADGDVDELDIDLLANATRSDDGAIEYDLSGNNVADEGDLEILVGRILKTYFGDANLDGEFNSTDMIDVFSAGEYDDSVALNSTWVEGDWNGDGDFDSSDLIKAFADGGYETGPNAVVSSVPEPPALMIASAGLVGLAFWRRVAR